MFEMVIHKRVDQVLMQLTNFNDFLVKCGKQWQVLVSSTVDGGPIYWGKRYAYLSLGARLDRHETRQFPLKTQMPLL